MGIAPEPRMKNCICSCTIVWRENQSDEFLALLRIGQLPVQDQITDFQEVAVSGQLLDRIAPIQQLSAVAVDECDRRIARSGRQETRVVGELAGSRVQRPMSITSGPMEPL